MSQASSPSFVTFAAFVGAIFAMGSLGIDALLPALPDLADSFQVDGNQVQFAVTGFVIGMGLGTLVGGPLSDRFGRRGIIFWGAVLYAGAALCALIATSLPLLVGLRALQGSGAAFAYVATTALVRDRYEGAQMARLMSLAAMVFATMPALAPLFGQALVSLAGWHAVFLAFAVLAAMLAAYVLWRIENAVPPVHSNLRGLLAEGQNILHRGDVVRPVLAQLFNMAALFAVLASIQPIFDQGYGRAAGFAWYFTLMALAVMVSSWLNGRLVSRYDALKVTKRAFTGQLLCAAMVLFTGLNGVPFGIFVMWAMSVFVMNGLTMGNLNTAAMAPLRHNAGLGATLIAAAGMIGGGVLAVPVGLSFNSTPVPLIGSILIFAMLSRLALFERSMK